MNRREALSGLAAGALAVSLSSEVNLMADEDRPPTGELIIDTHQHLWDLSLISPPWLEGAPEVLKHTYHHKEYAEATRGLNIKAIYMEVDVAPKQHDLEAEHVIGLCREASKSGKGPTIAAVIGGPPGLQGFSATTSSDTPRAAFSKACGKSCTTPSTPPRSASARTTCVESNCSANAA